MGIQELLVIALFVVAMAYIGRMIYRMLSSKKGCAQGCGKCGMDFSDVQPDRKAGKA